jgi:peptide/nickel transport system substrate-binding protein
VSRNQINRRVDTIRQQSSELENDLIDEYSAGRLSRRDFVRRGSVIGMSLPVIGFLASACGGEKRTSNDTNTAVETAGGKEVAVKSGGTLKTGIVAPAAELDPIKIADEGGLGILGQAGDYLTWSDNNLHLQPRLAESWKPSANGSVWTFKIRSGVKFSDGTPMTAEDVAATMNRLADTKVGSNSLSTFNGVLSKGGANAVDPQTVEFRLDAPNGSFPYLVSSDNYNAIILPKDYDGNWQKTFIGTGPWKLQKFTPNVGVTFVKNPDYWDKTRVPKVDTSDVKFYDEEAAQVVALQSGEVDVLTHYSVTGGKALLNNPNLTTIQLRSSTHRQMHMRNDKDPFTDKRVRQAVALAINRQAMVDGLFAKKADLGNDSPFAPVFPTTDRSVPQRQQDLAKAKTLLQQAGKGGGFSVTLDTWNGFEIPDLAQLVQNDLQQVGIKLKLNITKPGIYYGDAVYGKSPWLDSVMGITDYGHRGVPNVFLTAALGSKGSWNAAHFHNTAFDGLVKEYVGALDINAQKAGAKKIQDMLLDETPIVFPYFYYFLTGTKKNVANVQVTAMGHFDLTKAGFTAA